MIFNREVAITLELGIAAARLEVIDTDAFPEDTLEIALDDIVTGPLSEAVLVEFALDSRICEVARLGFCQLEIVVDV